MFGRRLRGLFHRLGEEIPVVMVHLVVLLLPVRIQILFAVFEMLLADLKEGRIVSDKELKASLYGRNPYALWLKENQITLDDPVVMEKPVTYTLVYKFVPNYEMVEFVCENNREYVDDKGVVRLQLHGK